MTRLHCWLLIGSTHVRKGSVVRALTGVGNGRDARVELRGGQWLELNYAAVSSINEGNNPTPPTSWVQQQYARSQHSRINLLIPMRLTIRAGFNAQDYISELDKAGAIIESIVTLGEVVPLWVSAYGAPFAAIPNSQDTPTATTAKLVREFWGWV
ncbi:hypothetical protein [Methylobacterium bullatum]|uniref:hypothetical protein n=1 Tax=Methylobacterium bullatum TaxID=570505 RepID=UPI0030CC2C3D